MRPNAPFERSGEGQVDLAGRLFGMLGVGDAVTLGALLGLTVGWAPAVGAPVLGRPAGWPFMGVGSGGGVPLVWPLTFLGAGLELTGAWPFGSCGRRAGSPLGRHEGAEATGFMAGGAAGAAVCAGLVGAGAAGAIGAVVGDGDSRAWTGELAQGPTPCWPDGSEPLHVATALLTLGAQNVGFGLPAAAPAATAPPAATRQAASRLAPARVDRVLAAASHVLARLRCEKR